MSRPGEGMKGQDDGTLEGGEWGIAGGEFLRGLRELASECASVIEWNEELVQKNIELTAQLETLRSRHEHLAEEIVQAVSKRSRPCSGISSAAPALSSVRLWKGYSRATTGDVRGIG